MANGDDGPPLGRELEIADLLAFIKRENIRNVAWITADVHYPATHRYGPEKAAFTDFTPFYEFVSGPLCAGGFGPNPLDRTFGRSVPRDIARRYRLGASEIMGANALSREEVGDLRTGRHLFRREPVILRHDALRGQPVDGPNDPCGPAAATAFPPYKAVIG